MNPGPITKDDGDFGTINITRSAFKFPKSPNSTQVSSLYQPSSVKDIRMKLDFSKVSNSGTINNLERNFFSDKKCSYDDNYISKKFILRKMNYNDMKQEVDKLNKVT